MASRAISTNPIRLIDNVQMFAAKQSGVSDAYCDEREAGSQFDSETDSPAAEDFEDGLTRPSDPAGLAPQPRGQLGETLRLLRMGVRFHADKARPPLSGRRFPSAKEIMKITNAEDISSTGEATVSSSTKTRSAKP